MLVAGSSYAQVSSAEPSVDQSASSESEAELTRRAADEYMAGRKAFGEANYDVAAVHFEKADLAAPTPESIRMAIVARTSANQMDRAATLAAAALRRYPNDDPTFKLATTTIQSAPSRLHKLLVYCDLPCSLIVGHRIIPARADVEATIFVEPGSYDVLASWSNGRESKRRVDAPFGGESDISFEAPELPKSTPSDAVAVSSKPVGAEDRVVSERPRGLHPAVFFSATGVSAALVGVSIWSAVDMRNNPGRDKVRADCAGKDEHCPTYQSAISAQRRTNVLFVTSGVAVVGTTVLGAFFTRWSDSKSHSETSTSQNAASTDVKLVPTLSVGGGVVFGASGSF